MQPGRIWFNLSTGVPRLIALVPPPKFRGGTAAMFTSLSERYRYDFAIGGSAYLDCSAVRGGEGQTVGVNPTPYTGFLPLDAPLLRKLPVVIEKRLNFSFGQRLHAFCFSLHYRRFGAAPLLSKRAISPSAFSAASISSRNRERAASRLKESPPKLQTRKSPLRSPFNTA